MKLGNIMRVEILNLKISIKDGLKNISRTKMENRWSTIYQGLYYMQVESIKTVYLQGNNRIAANSISLAAASQ